MVKYPLDENLTTLEKWLMLKELESLVKMQLKAMKDEMDELFENGECEGSVTKVTKTSIKPKDSIVKFLEDKDLLRLVKKDEIDLSKVKQLVSAGVIDESELNEHLEFKDSSYFKKK